MKRFERPFACVLQIRRNQRDHLRRELADLWRRNDRLCERSDRIDGQRRAQLDELRHMTAENAFDADALLSRRSYADRLADEITRIENERQHVAGQIDVCRAALLAADRGVESLEKLAERRLAELVAGLERRELLQHEEAWQAQRATLDLFQ